MKSYKVLELGSQKNQAIANKKSALASLDLLLDHGVGIGDHTTDAHTLEVAKALRKGADAEGILDFMKKHYGDLGE